MRGDQKVRGKVLSFLYLTFNTYEICRNIARFNSSEMTNLYPNRPNNEKIIVFLARSLYGTRPKTFVRRRNLTYFAT